MIHDILVIGSKITPEFQLGVAYVCFFVAVVLFIREIRNNRKGY